MKIDTTLASQIVRNAVREVGINPDYWYPVGWASQFKNGAIAPVTLWQQTIAIYRDADGQIHAVENACPHKGIELHKGEVQGCYLLCAYHGWKFDADGQCVGIPNFPQGQKLPRAQVRVYPVREKYGIVWVFPGDPVLAETCQLPEIPEFDRADIFIMPMSGDFPAHFSICNESTMDVFHGYLHRDLQGWFDPVLLHLEATDTSVCAKFQVSYRGWVTKLLRMSKSATQVTTRTIAIEYRYPHYHIWVEGLDAQYYIMRLPVSPTQSLSFTLFCFKIPLPSWLQLLLKPVLKILVKFHFSRIQAQDIEMMASEQQNYLANPQRRYVEINPAIIALQRLIIRQYEQFIEGRKQRAEGRFDF